MKKLKIFLIVALAIILVGGGYLLYMFKFKEYDVADEQVKEIVAEPYRVELPDGSTILIDENGEIIEEKNEGGKIPTSSANTNTNSETTDGTTNSSNGQASGSATTGSSNNSNNSSNTNENNSSGNNSNTNQDESKPATVASIKEKYRPSFQGLEAQADSKINSLIGRAVGEYNGEKANGESVNFGYFYNKYMAAANDLEANTDAIFNAVIAAVEKDLASNGYDKSYAQSFRDEYETTKKARRDSILKKALNR